MLYTSVCSGLKEWGNHPCVAMVINHIKGLLIPPSLIQEDILEGVLTVRENINFSAVLRLRRKTTRKERAELVDLYITKLGLTACADTIVGGVISSVNMYV